MAHKAGYVNIIGRPNVGKSTLMNQLVGEKISIITSKAQTTRHRILGIVNGDDFQIVFSDTPGIIKDPAYKMHEVMNQFVNVALIDADSSRFWKNYQNARPISRKMNSPTAQCVSSSPKSSERKFY